MFLIGNTCDFGVDDDAAAIFANDYFFAHLDFELFLRWDAVKAAAACVTLDVDNAQAVACVLADTFERVERICVDFRLDVLCLLA